MKEILAILLILPIIMGVFGCTKQNNSVSKEKKMTIKNPHTIYIRESYSDKIKAIFSGSTSKETEEVNLKRIKSSDDYNTYSCTGDYKKYDRVMFIGDDTDKSMVLVFNKYISGYHLEAGSSEGNIGIPFVYDEKEEDSKYETVSLKYNKDKEKNIFIYTPKEYDKNDKNKKYSVIYMCDGQNLFDKLSTDKGCWNVAESVNSMMKNSDNNCIVVGIDNGDGNRDNELTPNIGEIREGQKSLGDFENGTGKEFSNYVVNTVMKYINKNYNTYTDKEHTAVCGSSSGGLEAFYIGMEHSDKFSSIGALSPAFLLFNENTWNKYLKNLDFKGNYPLLYMYNGDGDELESMLLTDTKKMIKYLENINYPKDKIIFKEYKKACHNEHFWRSIFPEFLYYTFNK